MRLNFQTFKLNDLLDKTGATISWLCAIHCLFMPFVISFLPLLGISFLAHSGFEYVFIGLSITVAIFSIFPAYFRQHGKIRTLILFIAGICFVILADIIFEENLWGKTIFVFVGAIFITSAHFLNRRLCLECQNCEDSHSHSLS